MIALKRTPQVVADEVAIALWQESEDTEGFLREMRTLGARKIESIRVLRSVAGWTLAEAKEAVHFSQTWADTRNADDAFHSTLVKVAKLVERREARDEQASAAAKVHVTQGR